MNFRRWITVLAVLALFAGLASAQVASGVYSNSPAGALQCTASVAVPPILRSEGVTELVGDIVLSCMGGPAPTDGAQLPTANFTVSFGANVTSRLLTSPATSPTLANTNASEALLLIDEPGSGLTMGGIPTTGFGPGAPQTLCPYPILGAGTGGCVEYAEQLANGDYVMSSSSSSTTPVAGANVFQGIVTANQVTFYGIPIMPPTSAGVARVFRMTNIRINASQFGGGLAGEQSVVASVAISGPTSLPITNPVITAGFVEPGLGTGTKIVGGLSGPLNQCQNYNAPYPVGLLQFTSNFGTAFKTRVAPLTTTLGAGQMQNLTGQNVPGQIYNSESGLIFSALTQNGFYAGLSDYGTRLKAVFNNIPAGVSIYVSTTNIVNQSGAVGSGGLAPTASTDPVNGVGPFAELVLTDTSIDGNGTVSNVPATGYVTSGTTNVEGYAPVSIVSGTGTAVWEILNTNPSTPEAFDFGVYLSYTGNAAAGSPPTGTATVNLSFGPILASFPGISATTMIAASGTLTVPRFTDLTTFDNLNLFSIIQCSTSLLFPFVTNQAGFDTGMAIVNTTQDPFGTKPQAGTCAMWFYGQNAPTNPVVTPVIPAGNNITPGGNWAFLASSIAPNFEGYMIAICQFQFAHGYGFISDVGAQKLAMGYLALVLNNVTNPTSTTSQRAAPEALDQ